MLALIVGAILYGLIIGIFIVHELEKNPKSKGENNIDIEEQRKTQKNNLRILMSTDVIKECDIDLLKKAGIIPSTYRNKK